MRKLIFGFNSYFDNLQSGEIDNIRVLVSSPNSQVVRDYEEKFVNTVGSKGYGLSLASGRMAFYLLLKHLGIGLGDEVIVVGFTCSVMINAILRVGAKPIYTDVSQTTFGSDPKQIAGKISLNTKMIVAQHSFGIPCDIVEIVKIGKKQNIFVLEDCALALGSSVNSIPVGNFGDAAIFSTDHSKPINTLIGGFFYTNNKELFESIQLKMVDVPALSIIHQKNLFKQLLFEKKWLRPERYLFANYFNIYNRIRKKLFGKKTLFMDGDNGPPELIQPNYPYPAKLPEFLAQVGIYELEQFEKKKARRKAILKRYLGLFKRSRYKDDIPKVYFDSSVDIVPLRFIFTSKQSDEIKSVLSSFIDVSQIWFKKPIIATNYDLESMDYAFGSCSQAELMGNMIINLPLTIPKRYEESYFQMLENHIMAV